MGLEGRVNWREVRDEERKERRKEEERKTGKIRNLEEGGKEGRGGSKAEDKGSGGRKMGRGIEEGRWRPRKLMK